MQKKLLAVALAGAFGAPAMALAQSSTVQVFGTMYVEYTVHASQGDTPAGAGRSSADFLQTPGSEIGVVPVIGRRPNRALTAARSRSSLTP